MGRLTFIQNQQKVEPNPKFNLQKPKRWPQKTEPQAMVLMFKRRRANFGLKRKVTRKFTQRVFQKSAKISDLNSHFAVDRKESCQWRKMKSYLWWRLSTISGRSVRSKTNRAFFRYWNQIFLSNFTVSIRSYNFYGIASVPILIRRPTFFNSQPSLLLTLFSLKS